MTRVRAARPADFGALLALNAESVQVLSPLDLPRLEALAAEAAVHQVVEVEGQVAGFLLALREGAGYDSVNYRWFAERYHRFLYVDRIVVSTRSQRAGLGSLLYGTAFEYARAQGLPVITCEYDVEPANPASALFHARLGFTEVGRQRLPHGGKWVSLQAVDVA